VPGNHDVSNAIGYTKTMTPAKDGSVMAFIYNMFVKPNTFDTSTKALAQTSYDETKYANAANKVYYSRDIAGVHFMFINMWPDSDAQEWMANDLKNISSTTPAVIITHDQPETEVKHLSDPTGSAVFTNNYENLLSNISDFTTTKSTGANTNTAQMSFVQFLQRHTNIVAYFHGNDNYNELSTCDDTGATTSGRGCFKGPNSNYSVWLPEFRVDSPMKGLVSGMDATTALDTDKLSYQVITIDSVAKKMTVREFFWKTNKWGASATISLAPRKK
jgi:hypothetical protein